MAVISGRRAQRVPQYCGSRSKSHTMKALVLAALLLPPIGAAAVSPEDAYLAARDRYIASFKTTPSAKDEKASLRLARQGRQGSRAAAETYHRPLLGVGLSYRGQTQPRRAIPGRHRLRHARRARLWRGRKGQKHCRHYRQPARQMAAGPSQRAVGKRHSDLRRRGGENGGFLCPSRQRT